MKYFTFLCVFMLLSFSYIHAQSEEEKFEKAKADFSKANEYLQINKLNEAKALFQSAADFFKTKEHYTGNYISCRYSIADLLIHQNKFNEASEIISEIEKLSIDKFGKSNQFLRHIYYGKGIISASRGNQDDAVSFYEKALKINDEQANLDQFLKSNIFASLGNAYSEKGMTDKALEYYKEDLEIKKSIPQIGENNPMLAIAYNNISNLYKLKGEFDLALKHIEKALEINLNAYTENHPETARNYFNKGNIYFEKGQYDIALEFYKTAKDINIGLFTANHKSVADIENQIGVIFNKRGEYDKALISFRDAYDIQINIFGEDHPDLAITCNNIGNVLKFQKKYESSLKYFQKAVDIKIKYYGTNHPELAAFYNNIGIIYYDKKSYNSSKMYYLKAVDIIKNNYGPKNLKLVKIYANLGDIYSKDQDYYTSLYYFQKSISSNVKNFNPDSTDYYSNPIIKNYSDINKLLISLEGKAETLYKLYKKDSTEIRNLKESFASYILCDSIISIARKKVIKKSDKILLGEKSKKTYDFAVEIAIELVENLKNDKQKMEYLEAAFYFAENNKAVVLSEAVSASEAKYFIKLPNEIIEKERSLKMAIADFEKELNESNETYQMKIAEDNLFILNNELRKLNNLIESKYPKYHELKYKSIDFKISDIQSRIDENTAVRSYFLGSNYIFIFTVTKNGLTYKYSKSPDDFEQKIRDFKTHITSGYESSFKEYIAISDFFYKLLFPDELPENIKKLVIIPDGEIGLIPFESLLTEMYTGSVTEFENYPFLIKKYSVNYSYSAGLFLKLLKSVSDPIKKKWLGVAPVFNNIKERNINEVVLSELPGTEEEVDRIGSIFKDNNYEVVYSLNKNATESYIKSEDLKSFSYIHLATHGKVNSDKPNLSGLYLYPESDKEDNVLYSGEIYNMELDAHLAVLSACETGLGKTSKSEGIIGLSRSLLYAGADNIIVSLWQVSDESTSKLMIDFYTELFENSNDNTEALHKAKLRMINSGGTTAHPYFWSPFILIGK